MLSRNVQTELRAELAELIHERERMERRIAAIQTLLTDTADVADASHTPEKTAKTRVTDNGTFRSTVRHVLISSGRSMTTGEIVRELESAGIKAPGKTPLRTLVSTELWRAERDNAGIKKVKRGVYKALLN